MYYDLLELTLPDHYQILLGGGGGGGGGGGVMEVVVGELTLPDLLINQNP